MVIDIEKDTQADIDNDPVKFAEYQKKYPGFGMWRHRTDIGNSVDYVNKMREPRFPRTWFPDDTD